jgi:hypothetical protein
MSKTVSWKSYFTPCKSIMHKCKERAEDHSEVAYVLRGGGRKERKKKSKMLD